MSTTRHSPHHTQFLYLMACPVGGTSLEPFDLDRGHSRGLGKQTQDVVGYRRAVGSVVLVSVHTAQYCDSQPANSSGTGGTGGSDEIVAWLTAQTWTAPRQDVHTFLLFSASIFPPSLHDQLLVICPGNGGDRLSPPVVTDLARFLSLHTQARPLLQPQEAQGEAVNCNVSSNVLTVSTRMSTTLPASPPSRVCRRGTSPRTTSGPPTCLLTPT